MEERKSGFSVTGLVLGIIGIVFSIIPFINLLAYVMGILAFVFGLVAIIKKETKGMAVAGLTLGILAIVVATNINGKTVDVLNETFSELGTTTNAQVTKEEEIKEYSIGEEAVLGAAHIIVTNVEKSNGTTWEKPNTGKEFVIVHVTIENKGNSNISYNPYYFAMINSQGTKESMAFTTIDSDTALNSGELIPGGRVSGTVAFEQPKNDEGLILTYSDNIWSSKEVRIKL